MEIFAWPLAAVVFGTIVVLLFKPQVAALIDRVRSFGRSGFSTEVGSEARQEQSLIQQADAPSLNEVQDLLQSFDSPALLNLERFLFADLESRKLDKASPTTKILVRHLAKTRLLFSCEFIYRVIFDSQLVFLKQMNLSLAGIAEADAHTFYLQLSEANPTRFAFDGEAAFFRFLTSQGLVVFENSTYFIGDFGREFLSWLVQVSLPDRKPY